MKLLNTLVAIVISALSIIGVGNHPVSQAPITTNTPEVIESSESTTPTKENTIKQDTIQNVQQAVIVKPDYSELVASLRVQRDCWRSIEPKKKPKCDSGDINEKMRCIEKLSYPYVSQSQKDDADKKITDAINKLKVGILVDIHDTSVVPPCPTKPTQLHTVN